MEAEVAHLLEADDTPAWAKFLLRETVAIKSDISVKFEILEKKFGDMQKSIQTLTKDNKATVNRMSIAETRISALEDTENATALQVTRLQKEVATLQNQVDDLIGRSKRNNIRLINIKEGVEAGDMNSTVAQILSYVLGLEPGEDPPEIDRAHRSPSSLPDPGKPPRPIFVRLLRWHDRQLILLAAGKKQLSWSGSRFYVRQDLSPGVQKQRATYNDIISKIKPKGYRFGILHPARLVITINGQKLIYDSASDAEKDLRVKLPNLDWS